MRTKICYPDYKNSLLNLTNTLLKHYGVRTKVSPLPILQKALKRPHKNVVLMILDGMGIDMLQHNLAPSSFFRRNIKSTLSSVFPPTTTAATTTYYCGLSPVEHGWLGWSPYFKDRDLVIEMFTDLDYYTGKPTGANIAKQMAYVHIFDRIKAVNSHLKATEIFPSSIRKDGADNFDQFCTKIKQQTQQKGKQFILAYWGEPDHTSHEVGPYSANIKQLLKEFDKKVKELCAELEDTLVIISADHGHIENKKEIVINDYPDFMDCLEAPLSLDTRAYAIFLKPGKEKTFVQLFKRYFAKDFILMKSKEALSSHLFGVGKPHPRVKDMLGDYLMIATKGTSLVQRFPNDVYHHLVGIHAGLTNKEMLIPLIIIEKGERS